MSKLIVDGSQFQCTLGTTPQIVKVTSQTFVKIKDKLTATEKDVTPMVNIPAFGSCKRVWYQPACTPQTQKWDKVTEKDSINGMKKLTIESTCECSFGGTISFVNTDTNSFVDTE